MKDIVINVRRKGDKVMVRVETDERGYGQWRPSTDYNWAYMPGFRPDLTVNGIGIAPELYVFRHEDKTTLVDDKYQKGHYVSRTTYIEIGGEVVYSTCRVINSQYEPQFEADPLEKQRLKDFRKAVKEHEDRCFDAAKVGMDILQADHIAVTWYSLIDNHVPVPRWNRRLSTCREELTSWIESNQGNIGWAIIGLERPSYRNGPEPLKSFRPPFLKERQYQRIIGWFREQYEKSITGLTSGLDRL